MPSQEPIATATLHEKAFTGHRLALVNEVVAGDALSRIFQGFVTVASLTLVVKTISFVKEAAVAHNFGIGDELDAFVLSFTLVSFFSAMLGGGMPSSFLPVFSRLTHQRSPVEAHRLALQMALCTMVTFVLAGALLTLAAGPIVRLLSFGFGPEKQDRAAQMLWGMMPFFLGTGLAYHLSAWLRAQKCFVLAAITPVAPPAVIMVTLLSAGRLAPIEVLIHATNIGIILQLLILGIGVRRTLPKGNWSTGCFRRWEPDSAEVLRNTVPFLLSGIVIGSAPVVDQTMASWLPPGSVAVLGYSEKITTILLALTAAPAGEALFPFFADSVARHEWKELRRHLVQVTCAILAAVVPLTLCMCWFAPHIVRLLFERGEFGPDDTARVSWVLQFSVFQVPFYIASSLAARLAVSMQAFRFVLGMAAVALTINIVLNALLMRWLGVAGIALSTVIVHLCAAVAFYAFVLIRIRRRIHENHSP